MKESKFNFAIVFAIMVLLVFTYITFLGLVYWTGGDFLIPLLLSLGFIVIVGLFVYIMCLSKATRWKKTGLVFQIIFGLAVLVVFLFASVPFTNFLRVIKNSDKISEMVLSVSKSAINLDDAYREYVKERVKGYENNLQHISEGKEINPSRYKECLQNATGKTDYNKIKSLSKSLSNKLLPSDGDSIIFKRHQWLKKSSEINIWNPMTPTNIDKIGEVVREWNENYNNLSSISYMGEDFYRFKYERFNNELSKLMSEYRIFKVPSLISIIIAVICFLIMLLPYILTEGDLAGANHKKNENNLFKKM